MYESLFGNPVVESSLLYIVNYGEGYIQGIAKTFGYSASQVQRQLDKLEQGGILVSQFRGNIRVFKINPRLAIRKELITMCEKILTVIPPQKTEEYFRQRQRPRRKGKKL